MRAALHKMPRRTSQDNGCKSQFASVASDAKEVGCVGSASLAATSHAQRAILGQMQREARMMRSTKIADTTREERIQIVAEALAWGDDCGDCSLDACGIDKFYQPYIDGELELAELNMVRASTTYVLGDANCGERGASCVM
jgi:hypothetical protein